MEKLRNKLPKSLFRYNSKPMTALQRAKQKLANLKRSKLGALIRSVEMPKKGSIIRVTMKGGTIITLYEHDGADDRRYPYSIGSSMYTMQGLKDYLL